MKPGNTFWKDFLDFDSPETNGDVLWTACRPVAVEPGDNGSVTIKIPFQAQERKLFVPLPEKERKTHELIVRAYGDTIVRLSAAFGEKKTDDGDVMFEWHESLKQEPLQPRRVEKGWEIVDGKGTVRMRINLSDAPIHYWSDQVPPPQERFEATIYPDGKTSVPVNSNDLFFPKMIESAGLGFVERAGVADRLVFSMYAAPDEHFAGTGERFARMDLGGGTYTIENTDGLGVNSRRAYKNVPFYVSSAGYGLLVLTSAHVRFSLAGISTRAAQGLIEDDLLDLFVIGGNVEEVVYDYRRITGFPKNPPLWSYGTWMSRMTYFSAEETREVGRRMRAEKFPCDVLHLDTGWFKTDWKCEWEFSAERFPDPEGFMKEMRENGYRITLWQLPSIVRGTMRFPIAEEKGYLALKKAEGSGFHHGEPELGSSIDFSNPEAVEWYQGLLERLLKMGAAAMKTDFGEVIVMDVEYQRLPAKLLHNLYPLLYQKAAFEITEKANGEGLIWARAGWIGCQRYPLHWGGDAAATWDGLAGSIRGGLHIGVSGFGFWSHDVPGFHGSPNFMNSRPSDELYVRWTQFGVFSSHLRYHGTSAREPWEYPAIADIVRDWLNLRYALIPYLVEQGKKTCETGYPVLRALIFHHPGDPFCWHIDDQFYCGDDFLVAPVIHPNGKRDVYLPEGEWIDFWTGEKLTGPRLLKQVESPLSRMPLYVRAGAEIPVYPEPVQSTGEMDLAKTIRLKFDENYQGWANAAPGHFAGFASAKS